MTSPLAREIKALIASEGPISLARYMDLCLGHPRHGYYMTRDPFGAAGDFITAPEISQMFGELLGLWALAAWQQMGSPDPVHLVEFGPGRGTLMADALRATRLLPGFAAAARVHLVEISPVLRARQQATLANAATAHPISWHTRLEDLPDGPVLVLANEFFDALPISQFIRSRAGWHERRVGLDAAGELTFGVDPHPARLLEVLARHIPPPHPPGAVLERLESPAARALATRLAGQDGAALVIDYGHAQSGFGDTLQAMKAHAFVDPLAEPGEADLTAHVDFAALARAAITAGAGAFGPVPQGEFLLRLGLRERAERLQATASPVQADAITAALARLAGTGEKEMGALFKVLCICGPAFAAPFDPPPGFAPSEAYAETIP
ncbi:class I SAM-dependent methyltransferase [Roseixanthobacter pseudopolyaromaticivorans]|uniref:class I SAM-dependent methyltransferase n=1 Tax=Xanthobacteraceae TaxID=335928 RepID=UPI00372A3840